MTREQFLNGLRLLWSLDQHELVEAGVIDPADRGAWGDFRGNPHRWASRASDDVMDKLWALMCRRGALLNNAEIKWNDLIAGQAPLGDDNDGETWQTLELQHSRVRSIANPPKPDKYLYDIVVCGGRNGNPDEAQDLSFSGMSRSRVLSIASGIQALVADDDARLAVSAGESQP